MEPESSSPCSQELSTGPKPEPDQSNQYHPIPFNIVRYRPVAKRWLCKHQQLLCNKRINKHPFLLLDYKNRNGVIYVFRARCYKQDSLEERVSCWLELSAVQWSEVTWSSCLVSERVQLSEEKTRRFVWNGRQPGTQLVELSWQELCTGCCDKRTWAWEAEESPSVEAVARKRLVETVIDWRH
jgi:hypothetical protein